MVPWVIRQFGSVQAVEQQTIVRVNNRYTGESAVFNELRAKRPIESPICPDDILQRLERTDGCTFCNPENQTPSDLTGRVRGKHSVTASNVAKYDAHHGLVIPTSHSPQQFTAEKTRDYLTVALEWFRQQRAVDKDAACPYLMWNVLWRAGGTIIHGHLQMTMSTGGHYPAVERFKRAGDDYSLFGANGKDFFYDLYRAHEALGLGFMRSGSRIIAELTPRKEKGVMIIRNLADWSEFPQLAEPVHHVLKSYQAMGAQSFNVLFFLPALPLDNGWYRFPAIVRFIDRGPLTGNASDIGGMEFAEMPVIGTDPYKVMQQLVTTSAQPS